MEMKNAVSRHTFSGIALLSTSHAARKTEIIVAPTKAMEMPTTPQ